MRQFTLKDSDPESFSRSRSLMFSLSRKKYFPKSLTPKGEIYYIFVRRKMQRFFEAGIAEKSAEKGHCFQVRT